MIAGFTVPLQWPDDPAARAQMEGRALQMAAMLAKVPAQLDGQFPADALEGRARLARELTRHWPPGPGRPPEIARLAERYGEADAGGGESDLPAI
jgi:hypothetical protein